MSPGATRPRRPVCGGSLRGRVETPGWLCNEPPRRFRIHGNTARMAVQSGNDLDAYLSTRRRCAAKRARARLRVAVEAQSAGQVAHVDVECFGEAQDVDEGDVARSAFDLCGVGLSRARHVLRPPAESARVLRCERGRARSDAPDAAYHSGTGTSRCAVSTARMNSSRPRVRVMRCRAPQHKPSRA
jgi:hypothetical protein